MMSDRWTGTLGHTRAHARRRWETTMRAMLVALLAMVTVTTACRPGACFDRPTRGGGTIHECR